MFALSCSECAISMPAEHFERISRGLLEVPYGYFLYVR